MSHCKTAKEIWTTLDNIYNISCHDQLSAKCVGLKGDKQAKRENKKSSPTSSIEQHKDLSSSDEDKEEACLASPNKTAKSTKVDNDNKTSSSPKIDNDDTSSSEKEDNIENR